VFRYLAAVLGDVPREKFQMQHIVAQPSPHKPIAIDVAGEPLGVVIPSSEGFRFLAVRLPVFPLDGVMFETVEAAQRAAAGALNASDDD
jgi:hypothetical protein